MKLDVFNLAYIRHSVEIEINPTLITKHRHHQPKTNRIVTTTNNQKWWNSWWKTKDHSREGK
jgi:hypothetical protein